MAVLQRDVDDQDVGLERFKSHFGSLVDDPTESDSRQALVDVTREYCIREQQAAD